MELRQSELLDSFANTKLSRTRSGNLVPDRTSPILVNYMATIGG